MQSATILDVIRVMTTAHVHQVWVVDRHCKPMGVVTQASLLQTLYPFFRFVGDVQRLQEEQQSQAEEEKMYGGVEDGGECINDGEVKMICRQCHQLFVPNEEYVNSGSGSGGKGGGTNHDQACHYHPGHSSSYHPGVDDGRMMHLASVMPPSASDIWSCCNGKLNDRGCRASAHIV
jgi:hypothetical protein